MNPKQMQSDLKNGSIVSKVEVIKAVDELVRLQSLIATMEADHLATHRKLAAETLRADQGWARYEEANRDRNAMRAGRVDIADVIRDAARYRTLREDSPNWYVAIRGGETSMDAVSCMDAMSGVMLDAAIDGFAGIAAKVPA